MVKGRIRCTGHLRIEGDSESRYPSNRNVVEQDFRDGIIELNVFVRGVSESDCFSIVFLGGGRGRAFLVLKQHQN